MIEPIDNVSDPQQITPAARINRDQMSSTSGSGGQRLGPLLLTLAQEFGSYSSADQIAVLLSSVRLLVGAGLPLVDIVDSMYSNPVVLDALRDGNSESAKQAVILQVSDALAELRDSGVPDASLRSLSAAGFAAGEIAYALRTVPSLQEDLMQGDHSQLKQMLSTLHELFRDNGRSTHCDPTILEALGERLVPGLGGAQGGWCGQYLNRVRAAQMRSIGELCSGDHPELMLFSGTAIAPVDESSASFGAWMIAAIVGASVLLIIVSRC